MSVVVVDASVVVKWFIPEIHSERARRLLSGDDHYVAPDLLFAEIGSVIWKKIRRGELGAAEGRRLMGDVPAIAVETIATRDLVVDAHALAVATDITVYDAMYLALAARLDTAMITADDRLARKISSYRTAARHLRLLQELQ